MVKRLRAKDYFTSQRDYFFLSCHINQTDSSNRHCHEYYEVEIIVRGAAADEINGVSYTLNSGEFLFLRPSDVHQLKAAGSEGADLVNLAVSASLMHEVLSFLEIAEEQLFSPVVVGQLPQELLFLMSEQAQRFSAPIQCASQERAFVKEWMTICLYCRHALQKTEEEKLPLWMEQLLQEMKTPKGFIGGIDFLKVHIELSYPHVCRCFRKYLHKTPITWINEQRLMHSAYLLMHSAQSILEIALECGFHNLSHFNHLFKAFYGVAPTVYRTMRMTQHPMI